MRECSPSHYGPKMQKPRVRFEAKTDLGNLYKTEHEVGDVVRIIGGTYEYEVRYIMNGVGEAEMIVRSLDPLLIDRVQKMHHCEVEV